VRAQREWRDRRRGVVSADLDGLLRLVTSAGSEVRAAIEMMSGAALVAETLQAAGWQVQVADWRRARALAPLAAKTDEIDARALAEPARRDLVPAVWVGRRMPTGRCSSSCCGGCTWCGCAPRARTGSSRSSPCGACACRPAGCARQAGWRCSERRGVPQVWRDSVGEALQTIESLDERVAQLDAVLRPLAREEERSRLLATIAGVGPPLALAIASTVGDLARFGSASRLVGDAGLVPRIDRSGEPSRTGRLSTAGPPLLRWAAVEAAQQAWRPRNRWRRLCVDVRRRHRTRQRRHGRGRAQGADRPLAPARRQRTLQAGRGRGPDRPGELRPAAGRLTARLRI
jgi:Transposase IS116/IS110/IS902 family